MIIEKKRWMTYTWYNASPSTDMRTTHLHSLTDTSLPGMVKRPFKTMVVDIRDEDFLKNWSSSTRTKVHRAEAEGMEITRGKVLLPEVIGLFVKTAKKKKLRGHKLKDFDSRTWVLPTAVFQGSTLLGGHVWVIDEENKRATLFINAIQHQTPEIESSTISRAHYYLLWQDGLFFHQKGFEILDLHGYEKNSSDPALKGVFRWKEGTHGKVEQQFHYYPFWFYIIREIRKWFVR